LLSSRPSTTLSAVEASKAASLRWSERTSCRFAVIHPSDTSAGFLVSEEGSIVAQKHKEERHVPLDMLDRLILDPGTRTLGELFQEREWSVGEIRRLRAEVDRLSRKREALRIERELEHAKGFDPAVNAQRLLRLAEVSAMVGLRRSAIYQHISKGRFPAPVKVGDRSVRWKLADVLAWRAHISKAGELAGDGRR
jgi:prophage regulatory protein